MVAEVELNMMTRVQKVPFITGNVYRSEGDSNGAGEEGAAQQLA